MPVAADKESGKVSQHGVPAGACEDEPKGLPTSDRHYSETSVADNGGNAEAEKHRHVP